ncbi:MAG: hypothetical protein QOE68_554 [Thermoanaerobaculia bacterium]|jgi:hypothetical protein|nr:hypothetical protein [Thermoanaerobaculia bacterium]
MDEDIKQLILTSAAETRRHFEMVAEEMRHHVQLSLEGAIANGAKIDQLAAQMKEEFIELGSMIRISYTQLDRRLRTLEETVSGLLTRVDRLESASTQ